MSVTLRRLFLTNPLLEEATRAWRKFFRVAGGSGKGLSFLLVGILVLIYLWLLAEIVVNKGDVTDFLLFFQLALVTLAMPMSIYGAISGERERTTWEALILTRLTPGQIVAGKMLWRGVTLLIVMALFLVPMLVSRLVGDRPGYGSPAGRSLGVFLLEELMTFVWGLGLCAFGLWVSANTRRSVTSIALIFISLLTVLALLPTLAAMLLPNMGGDDFGGSVPMWLLMHVNSFYALFKMAEWQHRSTYDGLSDFSSGEWGVFQTVIYALAAFLFLYATLRSLRIHEEPKRRIG